MRILQFVKEFKTEESCKNHFKQMREKEGVYCKKCNGSNHYWLASKYQWQCTTCEFRTTLRSGTIMEYSKMPFLSWYLAMAFMTFSKKGISAVELQKQLEHSRYDSIWRLMMKIRQSMGLRDGLYSLKGEVEFDEGFFEIATKSGVKLKRGKGSQRQSNVAVLAESTQLEEIETGKISKQCRYFKMKVLDTQKADSVNAFLKGTLSEQSIVFSDKGKNYVDIADYVEAHVMEKSTKEVTATTLKWVHIAISNAKRNLLGIYHKIKGKYLQSYLDEFCYKLNRRYFGQALFNRLTLAVAKSYWYANG